MHKPISLKDISLSFTKKFCFENFSTQISPSSRIAIIGRNGSGKSSLLKIIRGVLEPSTGEIVTPDDLTIGYVEQTIEDYNELSGGQRLNKRLTEALSLCPNILLLDEPTNHLDLDNRKSLIRMLQNFAGTLIMVSHDTELLRKCTDTLWHIDQGLITEHHGSYDDYMREQSKQRAIIERELIALKRDKHAMHEQLMKEQKRAANSKAKGQKNIDNKKWATITSKAKAGRAEKTSGKKKSAIDKQKQYLTDQLSELRLPEIIVPKFSLAADHNSNADVVSISNAEVGYDKDEPIIKDINLSVASGQRIAIFGKNASGKSTLLKAILDSDKVFKTGEWYLPKRKHIGYLDQHYSNLNPEMSVIDQLEQVKPDWNAADIRKHLNDFLFRKNEEVNCLVQNLSGGEKARLSLCLIAANAPRLLILDEITNNLDLETKEHITQILKLYPGSMLIVSHEEEFLNKIGIDHTYAI